MHCDCIFAFTRKNDAFVAKIVNTRLTKIFIAIFAPDERLPRSATLIVYDWIEIVTLMSKFGQIGTMVEYQCSLGGQKKHAFV